MRHACSAEPVLQLGQQQQQRAFRLGSIAAFAETVGAGCKSLALSPPMSTLDMVLLIEEARAIARRNGAEIFLESDFLHTDLFPDSAVAAGQQLLLIYRRGSNTLAEYQNLKGQKRALLQGGKYRDASRVGIARAMGRLLSYDDAKISALLKDNTRNNYTTSVAEYSSSSTSVVAARKARIGILGGSGPEAGADLFAKVLTENRRVLGSRYTGDQDAPEILLLQVPGLGGGTPEEKWAALESSVLEIAPQVECFSVACNYLHTFAEQIQALLQQQQQQSQEQGEFVSMIEATGSYCYDSLAEDSSLVVFGGVSVMNIRPVAAGTTTADGGDDSPYAAVLLALAEGKGITVRQDVVSISHVQTLQTIINAVKTKGAAVSAETIRAFEEVLRAVEEVRYTRAHASSGWLLFC